MLRSESSVLHVKFLVRIWKRVLEALATVKYRNGVFDTVLNRIGHYNSQNYSIHISDSDIYRCLIKEALNR